MSVNILYVPKSQHSALLAHANPHMDQFAYHKLEGMLVISDEVYAGFVDKQYVCCWGLVPPSMMSDKAYLWLQTTPKAEEHKFILVRHSQRCVEVMLQTYEELVGFCVSENKAAIRWIEWLGGEFKKPFAGRVDFVIRRKSPVEALCG